MKRQPANLRVRLAGLSTAVGALLGGVAGFFVVRALARDWDDVRDGVADAGIAWLVGAVVLAVAGMTAIAVPWRRALRILGGDLPWGEVLARYYLGELGKYVPGGIWPVLGRGELAARAGVPRLAAYGSVGLSLAALYLAAMFLALAAVPTTLDSGDANGVRAALVLLLLPLGILGLHHAVLERVRNVGQRALRRSLDVPIPRWRASLSLLVGYLPAWLLIGGATWAVARAMGQDAGYWELAPAAVLSWIVGFVLVPVPGGLGVREVTFVAASGLAPGVGAAVAVVARVMFVVVDGTGALIASAWLGWRERTRRRDGGSVSANLPPSDGAASVTRGQVRYVSGRTPWSG